MVAHTLYKFDVSYLSPLWLAVAAEARFHDLTVEPLLTLRAKGKNRFYNTRTLVNGLLCALQDTDKSRQLNEGSSRRYGAVTFSRTTLEKEQVQFVIAYFHPPSDCRIFFVIPARQVLERCFAGNQKKRLQVWFSESSIPDEARMHMGGRRLFWDLRPYIGRWDLIQGENLVQHAAQ